jgi:AraC-like DNA-binding protein
MASEIIYINTVNDYTDYFGLDKTDPQIGLVDVTKATNWPSEFRLTFGVYAVLLMGSHCGEVRYGRQGKYDFDSGTIVTYAPGQTIDVKVLPGERPSARGILFTLDYIRGTSLGEHIKDFSFFSYAANEALYVNEDERQMFFINLERIRTEMAKPTDDFSRSIVCMNIELLLSHCSRFYARQFETRREPDHDVFIKFEKLLSGYFTSDLPRRQGLPTVKYFAENVFLSPNYFGDLIKSQTGQTAREYIHKVIIATAKDRLLSTDAPITEIAYNMGFQTTQHFSTMFKKSTGMTPVAFRQAESDF